MSEMKIDLSQYHNALSRKHQLIRALWSVVWILGALIYIKRRTIEMDNSKIAITVITVVYNDESHIESTIKSVIGQTYPYIEYIIIDGNSIDGTLGIIKRYSQRLRYLSERDNGIYNAMNKGLKMATGDFVIFMNSGDCFTSNNTVQKITKQIANQHSFPYMVYGNYREVGYGKISAVIPARTYKKVWYGSFASHQSTFYNRLFLLKEGLQYDESYKIAADYKLNLEVVKRADDNILQTEICVSDFDITGVSNVNQDLGLAEADRARYEVLKMNKFNRKLIVWVQLCARFAKKNLGFLYKAIRLS